MTQCFSSVYSMGRIECLPYGPVLAIQNSSSFCFSFKL
jgi:hypothetical protein